MSTYTYLLQVLRIDGYWGNLRDPRSGVVIGLGTVTVPETELASTAHNIMQSSKMRFLRQRIVFFEGDRRDEALTGDDVYGVVDDLNVDARCR